MDVGVPVWSDAETGLGLRLSDWPAIDGIPILVPDPEAFVLRHGPRVGRGLGMATVPHEPIPVDAPDALTPHLPPGRWPLALLPPEPLGTWVRGLGERCPDAVCSDWGRALAPEGPSLDAGCGVGGMARRMAESGRQVLAFDRSPDAVRLARALLTGGIREVPVPMARAQASLHAWPHAALPKDRVRWAVADVRAAPIPPDTFAWVHLGAVLDMVDEPVEAIIDALAPAICSGGLLTVATPHDEDQVPVVGSADPVGLLREALGQLGFEVVAEDRAVPWVVRQYNRACRVLFVDCIAARVTW